MRLEQRGTPWGGWRGGEWFPESGLVSYTTVRISIERVSGSICNNILRLTIDRGGKENSKAIVSDMKTENPELTSPTFRTPHHRLRTPTQYISNSNRNN